MAAFALLWLVALVGFAVSAAVARRGIQDDNRWQLLAALVPLALTAALLTYLVAQVLAEEGIRVRGVGAEALAARPE